MQFEKSGLCEKQKLKLRSVRLSYRLPQRYLGSKCRFIISSPFSPTAVTECCWLLEKTNISPLVMLCSAQTNMVKSLSLQLAPFGITVNNMAPGVIYTDRNTEALSDPEYAKKVTASIPVGFYGTPEDCAGTVSLLCSDEGRYITGQSIYVDGGKSVQ